MTRTLRPTRVPLLGLCLTVLASAAAAQPQLRYRVTEISPPNARNLGMIADIDNSGRVAGSTYAGSLLAPSPRTDITAFLRSRNGAFVGLEVQAGATATTVLGIGQNGTLFGSSGMDFDVDSSAVIWDRWGRATDLGVLNPGDTMAFATDVDFRGRVMGASGTLNNVATTGFVWDRGVFAEISIPGHAYSELWAFGSLDSIAGNAWNTAQYFDSEGFIIDRKGNLEMIGLLPNGSFSAIHDMNLFGVAVGLADGDTQPGTPPFQSPIVYRRGTLTSFGTLPGDIAAGFYAVNNWGTAIGFSFGPATGPRPIISRFGGALEDLSTMLDPAAAGTVDLVRALGINDWGQIVAEGFDPIAYPEVRPLPPGATFYVLLTPYYE